MKNFWGMFFLMGLMISSTGCSDNDNDDGNNPGIQFLAKLELDGTLTDVWGYVDEAVGKEYAVVGYGLFEPDLNSGVHIVDVTDPRNPVLVASTNSVPGFDVKVWRNYIYTVNGSGNGAGGILDISDPANPQNVGAFTSSHNIFITENGFMYLEVPGIRIYDLNPDPTDPQLVWSGGSNGHDATVIGPRLYDFNGIATNIYDVSDQTNPQLLGSINAPFIRFHHSGWPTTDGQFLFICDEGSRHPDADITVWNISDPGNPQFVTDFKDSTAIVHNLYIIGDFAYVAYYNSGFRVFDVSDPGQIKLLDEYDTSVTTGERFEGAFGVYAFAPSGNIYVSDMFGGLHIFKFNADAANSTKILAP